MKILIVMDPGIQIPPQGYGGIERVIDILAKEYVRLGHEVHLLVTDHSKVEGCTIHHFGKEGFPPKKLDALKAIPKAWKFLWKHRNDFDLVHSFGRLMYLLPILYHPVKKIMSYQREITSRNIRFINSFGSKTLAFTACSADLLSRVRSQGHWEVIYNAVEFSRYTLQEEVNADAPLIFLGRIERIKGCHTAIQVAKATGNRLIIAGNISSLPEERDYFKTEVEPLIDGKIIQYVGQVNDDQKNLLLGKSKAMLFPIEWNEPFGIVMAESMACGTPVIGFTRGSVGEVIDEGITGFKVNTVEEMEIAVNNLGKIDRRICRIRAEQRFDITVIAKRYLEIFGEHRKAVLLLTTHQPAANPRLLKEYLTLSALNYKVNVVYAYNADWSYKIDEEKFRRGSLKKQDFSLVGGHPSRSPLLYFISRVFYKLFKVLGYYTNSFFCRKMATARPALNLLLAARSRKADIYIAHYLGALPAAISAAKKYGGKVIFDAEDFHRGEQSYYPSQMSTTIIVEDKLLPLVDHIITASPLITEQYRSLYPGKAIQTINNVFSIKHIQPLNQGSNGKLKLFWFSQNIGNFRGLEVFIKALNYVPPGSAELTILGNVRSEKYKNELLALARDPRYIHFVEPLAPEDIFSFAAGFDIGLAGEIPHSLNKDICLSNKMFTYLLAGNCILASDVLGQKQFIEQYPGVGYVYKSDDAMELAQKIEMLYKDRELLNACKLRSLQTAKAGLNWEKESDKFHKIIQTVLKEPVDKGELN